MGSLIQISGHNLARQRDKLGHVLQDLAALQEEVRPFKRLESFLFTILSLIFKLGGQSGCVLAHNIPSDGHGSFPPGLPWHLGPPPHAPHNDSVFILRFRAVSLQCLRVPLHLLVFFSVLLKYARHIFDSLFPSFLRPFRYLYEFLYGWLISAYNRADSFLTEHQSMTEYLKSKTPAKGTGSTGGKKGGAQGGSSSNSSSAGKSAKKKKDKNGSSTVRPYAKDIAYCQAVQSMCGGYYKASLIRPAFRRSPFFFVNGIYIWFGCPLERPDGS